MSSCPEPKVILSVLSSSIHPLCNFILWVVSKSLPSNESLNLITLYDKETRASQVMPVVKYLTARAGDVRDASSTLGFRRSLERGHDNPLQYSCLENHMDRGTWWAIVHGMAKSGTQLK